MHRTIHLLFLSSTLPMLACSGTSTCQTPVTDSDSTTGTYSYSPPSNAAAAGCASTMRSDLSAATGTTVRAIDESTIEIGGAFDDETGSRRHFTLRAVGLAAGSKSSPSGVGGEICDDSSNCTQSISWVSQLTTYSSECQSAGKCVLTVTGTMGVSGTIGEGTFRVELALDHRENWAPSTCATHDEGS